MGSKKLSQEEKVINEMLAQEARASAWKAAALAYRDLATCYRTGSRPDERLHSRLDRARELWHSEKS